MNRIVVLVLLLCAVSCVAGCTTGSDVPASTTQLPADITGTSASAAEAPTTVTVSFAGASSGAEETEFIWRPDIGTGTGSDVANRRAFGIIDGEGEILYFQGTATNGSSAYALYSCDEESHQIKKLAPDCYGMVNVAADAVFYTGYETKGIFCYVRATGEVKELYLGDVNNLVQSGDLLYFIDGDNSLRSLHVDGGIAIEHCKNVSPNYLEVVGQYLYFSKTSNSDNSTEIYRFRCNTDGLQMIDQQTLASPLKYLGKQMLWSNSNEVYLTNEGGTMSTVFEYDGGLAFAAANGSAVFYTRVDEDGFAELFAYDLETGKTFNLMPVHCASVCFIGSSLYLVNVENLNIERVVVDGGVPRTEWVVEH